VNVFEADWVEISLKPLDAAKAIEFVADPAAGGIDVFLGTTRSEQDRDGHNLVALD